MHEAAGRPSSDHDRLIRKLESIAVLGPAERRALGDLPLRVRLVEADTDLVNEGDRPGECCLALEGFFCRYAILGGGQRSILAFHIPGDMLDLQGLHLGRMDHSIAAMTPARVGYAPHAALQSLMETYPAIAVAFWRDSLVDAAIFRQWLASTGRRTAHQRVAHLLCELAAKLRAVGLAERDGFELPLTQAELADALGLSSVHVNRVLQDLRRDGLIVSRGRWVGVPNLERLHLAADFDPLYLHLRASEPS